MARQNETNHNDNGSYLSHIETSFQPMDIAFHPFRDNLVAAALVDGTLEVHDIRKDDDPEDSDFDSLLSSLSLHSPPKDSGRSPSKKAPTASCKCVAFSPDGTKLYTGGSPFGDLCAVDAERACTFSADDKIKPLWRINSATASTEIRNVSSEYNTNKSKNNPISTLYAFRKDGEAGNPLLATGDDCGGVRVWDERLCGGNNSSQSSGKRPKGCVLEWNQQEDYISGIEYYAHSNGKNNDGNNILLATSADGSLGVYDLRMNKGAIADTTRKSDHLDDELLSLCVLKSGKKVVCGTQTGALSIFSWGTWGDISDRFPGHPSSVETLLKVDENTLLTGASDGVIRVVQIHPDKLLGILNDGENEFDGHGGNSVEKLAYNSNRDIVGSVSHDNFVRLWDARILKDDDDSDDQNDSDADEEEDIQNSVTVAKSTTTNINKGGNSDNKHEYNSDDEWEDMDGEENDNKNEESDDSDSDESIPETANDRRKKRLKTENEKFFDDL